MSPSSFYYIGLFVLVFLVRFFKLKRETPQEGEPQRKSSLRRVTFVSLEIVYTAAGFVILLLSSVDKAYIAPIVVAYVILIYVSSQLESLEDKFTQGALTTYHSLITAVVVVATTYSFSSYGVLGKQQDHGAKATPPTTTTSYRIAIPYVDKSLFINSVSYKKFGDKQFFFQTVVDESISEPRAIEAAKAKFWDSPTTNPIYNSNNIDKKSLIGLSDDQTFVVRATVIAAIDSLQKSQ
jgi:hypothetical protein